MSSSAPARRDYIDSRLFPLIVLGALVLHIIGIYIWSLMPGVKVVDVPVRALSIKLTDSDELTTTEAQTLQPNASNNTNVESTVSHLVRNEDEEKARQQTVAASMDKAIAKVEKTPAEQPAPASATTPPPPAKAAPAKSASKAVVKGKFNVRAEGTKTPAPIVPVTAHQFVRDNQTQQVADNNTAPATPANNDAHNPDLVAHYEQLISLWIQKFKIYPIDARSEGLQGETVVRIRIDRQGNIRYYALEHTTGHAELDHAAIDMIKRANPVPAVPADYPPGDLMEFLIPVSFHLQS